MEDYINTLPESQRNNSQKNLIIGFLKDVFEQAFYLEDEDTGERTPVPSFNLYRIPYLNVSIVSDS
ncbi:hypothetical protein ERJ77_20740, partial [Vibrio anguillarum]|nr:hypothetical protein [Vibrio anguillarum]